MKKIVIMLGLPFLLIFTPRISLSHIPYLPICDTHPFFPYNVAPKSAPLGKSITVYEHFDYAGDLDAFYFRLTPSDLVPELTMSGFTEEDTDQEVLPENQEVPLVVADENGIVGRKFFIRTLIPGCPVYSNLLPCIAIVGPEQTYLPAYTENFELPFKLKEGEGIHYIENYEQGVLWYEPFTFKSYINQEDRTLLLTEPGIYKIYIWEPSENKGDYILELGFVEVMGVDEILRSLFFVSWQVNDGDISCARCKDELEDMDGPNPTIWEVLFYYYERFVK